MKSPPKHLHDARTDPQRGDRLLGRDGVVRTVAGRELGKIPASVFYTQNADRVPPLDPTRIEKCALWDWMQWAQGADIPDSIPRTGTRLSGLLSRLRRRERLWLKK
jgi:hypothetical protein